MYPPRSRAMRSDCVSMRYLHDSDGNVIAVSVNGAAMIPRQPGESGDAFDLRAMVAADA